MGKEINVLSDYFLQNLWWIVLVSVVAVIIIVGVIYVFIFMHSKKTQKEKDESHLQELEKLLGGKENVVSHRVEGSRIMISLKDYSKIDETNLRALGVTGFIRKTDQITLVFKENAKEIYQRLFGE